LAVVAATTAQHIAAEERRVGIVGVAQLHVGEAIIAPGIGQPDIGIAPGVKPKPAAYRHIIQRIPGEAQARHQQIQAIQSGVITQATIECGERLIELWLIVAGEPVVAHTGNHGQRQIGKLEFILKIERVLQILE
jgi:hypothetical protein